MSISDPIKIEGAAGLLEAQLDAPSQPQLCAVLCHPHPLYGGNMHDAVLSVATDVLREANCAVIRFNYRGVGASAGSYSDGIGEADDVAAVLAWARQRWPDTNRLLLGYSFGAACAWRLAADPAQGSVDTAGLWLLAPPVALLPDSTSTPATPVTIFHPDNDDFTSANRLQKWLDSQAGIRPTVHPVPDSNHFFHDSQRHLAALLRTELDDLLTH